MSAKTRGTFAAFFVALFFALCATVRSGDSGQPAISEVTVLLPFTSEHETVSKVLTARNGCFKWFVFPAISRTIGKTHAATTFLLTPLSFLFFLFGCAFANNRETSNAEILELIQQETTSGCFNSVTIRQTKHHVLEKRASVVVLANDKSLHFSSFLDKQKSLALIPCVLLLFLLLL